MPTKAYYAAVLAAIAGAAVWGLVSWGTGYEVGYIAWGIGFLVGVAAVKFGGQGTTCGVACGALALLSILGGKVVAVELYLQRSLATELSQFCTEAAYEETMQDARDVAALDSEDGYRKFMITHHYTEASRPQDISGDELAGFEATTIPDLRRLHEEQPDFETWRTRQLEVLTDIIRQQSTLLENIKSSLSLWDILFMFFGVATAYQIGTRGSGAPATREDEVSAEQAGEPKPD